MDRTTTKYVNRLVQRVDAVYRHLRQRCDLPALPTLPKRANAQTEMQHNEKPKLLQQMRELNAQAKGGEATTKPQEQAKAATKAATKTTTTTTTKAAKPQQQRTLKEAKATTTRTTKIGTATGTGIGTGTGTGTSNVADAPVTNVRKKRKMIVFESDDMGVPIARVEYH